MIETPTPALQHSLSDEIARLMREQASPARISSQALLGSGRMIEIDHEGRVYQLRLTQSNKLILTA